MAPPPGNRSGNDSVRRADSDLAAEQDGIARLRADLSRIDDERKTLLAKREPLATLVQR